MSRSGIKWNIAKPTWVDGIRFASKAEARRYGELRLLALAGEVMGLAVQPVFPLEVMNATSGEMVQVGVYKADFAYWFLPMGATDPRYVVEDVKGMSTVVYRLKKRLVEALYGITIVEVR